MSEAFRLYSRNEKMKYMIHLIEIDKIHVDSAITVEMYPIENDMIYVFLLDHDYIPTITKFEHAAIFSLKDSYEGGSPNTSAVWNSDGEFFEWFVENDAVENRTGRWILTVLTLKELVNISSLLNNGIDPSNVIDTITGDYSLRTFHSGCYYFNKKQYAWVADGVKVTKNEYGSTLCRGSHLTSFAAGFFVKPNTIDFDFVFAKISFTDNLSIYMTIIICLLLYIMLSIWAWFADKKDKERLISLGLPDNDEKHKYLYEILTFTGHWEGSSCDSGIFFELTGDHGSTGARQLDIGRKDTLRKGTIDSYIMKTSRYT